MRTATLDLNSRGSFVDDLNSKPGIVMCRDALLHRSHEIQPAFFDSEKKRILLFFFFFSFYFFIFAGTCLSPAQDTLLGIARLGAAQHQGSRSVPFLRLELILSGRGYQAGTGTFTHHTFSAFWLRSSVVSVLISLISGTWRMASHEFK